MNLNQEGKNNPNYKENALYRQKNYCIDCNTLITPYGKRCKSCNNSYQFWKNYQKRKEICLRALKTIENCGEKNPSWIDGRSYLPYSPGFTKKLKKEIKKRDNYQCQNCNMTEEEHLIILGFGLSIHHIDYDKKNNDKTNLITTCTWCNLRANYNRDYWINYYKEKIK